MLSRDGAALQEALAGQRGKENKEERPLSKYPGGRHAAHFLSDVRRLAGDRDDRMSLFCSQLVGVGVGGNTVEVYSV